MVDEDDYLISPSKDDRSLKATPRLGVIPSVELKRGEKRRLVTLDGCESEQEELIIVAAKSHSDSVRTCLEERDLESIFAAYSVSKRN